jgi:ribosomal-protein-alanine N-acetyltransferase
LIRNAEVTDLEAIVDLEMQVFGHSLGFAFLKQELLENEFSHIYVYTLNNKIIAYISYRQIDTNADVLNFVVDKNHQRRGVGSQLFEHVLLDMKQGGVNSLILEVRVSNINAIKFYEKYGAKVITGIPNYYGNEDGFMMHMEVK